MSTVQRLPSRSEVQSEDTWDLGSLFPSDEAWEASFQKFESRIPGFEEFRGRLGESAVQLANCFRFDLELDQLGERLGVYAFLKTTEDQTNSDYQRMLGRFQNAAMRANQAASYIRPEILELPVATLEAYLASEELAPYRLLCERILRYKPHTLGRKEEELLALQSEMSQAASHAFRQLLDADLKFGPIRDHEGQELELTNATFSQLLHSPDRGVRQTAFLQYYAQFKAHENTLSATLSGSIQKDVYYARARGHANSLAAALFPDKVPQSVYDNLIQAVRRNLPAVHHYYDVRRRKMQLAEIHHYDTYVPILSELETRHLWHEAVDLVLESLQPLGAPYVATVEKGLRGRWCDRYPNQGKQSGAFSSGSYGGEPYILMNYKPEVLDDVFTLAHEAGHSMHSHLSSKHQPYQYYEYSIFVAEVASTFNEQLLSRHLLARAEDNQQRAYLINREIDGIRGTIIRQTMFAEFEKVTHEMAEAGEPLTVKALQSTYGELLGAYFGSGFAIDKELSCECLRIPHFYRAFYVYKYATGLSAAIVLSQRVVEGGQRELDDYLGFLKGGCSKYPLDLLRGAGVDMESPEPVNRALAYFGRLVEELDTLVPG